MAQINEGGHEGPLVWSVGWDQAASSTRCGWPFEVRLMLRPDSFTVALMRLRGTSIRADSDTFTGWSKAMVSAWCLGPRSLAATTRPVKGLPR